VGVKIHRTRAHKQEAVQAFEGRLADRAVQVKKMTAQQKLRPTVHCEDKPLKNVFKFTYLGTVFAADGLHDYDIASRIARAQTRCGQLRNILHSEDLNVKIKTGSHLLSANIWFRNVGPQRESTPPS
jgi:hypothetical protein